MSQSLKMKGRTIDEAIEAALTVLKVSRDKVDINVLNEPESSVLGVFGGRMAEVEVSVKESEEDMAKRVLQEILDKMGFLTLVDFSGRDAENIMLEIKGEDMGRIIGRDGLTLNSLQFLISSIVARRFGKRVRISLDAQGYKRKKQKKLESIALDAAQKAVSENTTVKLDPMPPADRRIIHLALQSDPRVETHSEGELVERRIIISPKKNA